VNLNVLDPSARLINPARRQRRTYVAGAKSIEDLRRLAQRRLPNFVYEYIEGGAEAELTPRQNIAALDNLCWLPKIAMSTPVNTATTLLGGTASMPIVIAPTGFNGMVWPKGDRLIAEAASSNEIPAAQSTASMMALEDVAGVPALRHWFQLYPYGDDVVLERLLVRALASGSEALIVTVDGAVPGNRLWDQRNFHSPGRLNLRNKLESLLHPAWLWEVILRDGPPNFVNLSEFTGSTNADVFTVGRWIAANRPQLNWDRLADIRKRWPNPLIVKGVLRLDEARKAVEVGADAIVLSNHGGRQIDQTISPLEILADVRHALGPDYPILVDSGYRTGGHICMALALGASAVLVGKPVLYGLAAGGRQGVERALAILRAEIERTMALLAVPSINELSTEYLAR
jgi:(S)-mandelate dehydrogenase